jgi:hypothetical protein
MKDTDRSGWWMTGAVVLQQSERFQSVVELLQRLRGRRPLIAVAVDPGKSAGG